MSSSLRGGTTKQSRKQLTNRVTDESSHSQLKKLNINNHSVQRNYLNTKTLFLLNSLCIRVHSFVFYFVSPCLCVQIKKTSIFLFSTLNRHYSQFVFLYIYMSVFADTCFYHIYNVSFYHFFSLLLLYGVSFSLNFYMFFFVFCLYIKNLLYLCHRSCIYPIPTVNNKIKKQAMVSCICFNS